MKLSTKKLTRNSFICLCLVLFPFLAIRATTQADFTQKLYDDNLASTWVNWSWNANPDFYSTNAYQGSKAIAFNANPWGGLYLHSDTGIDTTPFISLTFAVKATNPNQQLAVIAYDQNNTPLKIATSVNSYGGTPTTDSWKIYNIPLADINANNRLIKGVAIQNANNQAQTFYIDEIGLFSNQTTLIAPLNTSSSQPNQPATTSTTLTSASLFSGSLDSAWTNWSWNSTVNFGNSVSVNSNPWGALYLHDDSGFDTSNYQTLHLNAQAQTTNAKLGVALYDTNNSLVGNFIPLSNYGGELTASAKDYNIPLSDLKSPGQIKGIAFQNISGQAQTITINNISLTGTQTATNPNPSPIPSSSPNATTQQSALTSIPPKKFYTLPPGSALPSDQDCANAVTRSKFEPRPENYTANHTLGAVLPNAMEGITPEGNAEITPRIDGNFTGTTDEIIRWGACKWGFDEDDVRAVAAKESWWKQSTQGDFNGSAYESYGLLQVRRTAHIGTYPLSSQSTAFNVDYALAWRRACYEGYFYWIPQSAKGDEWGCIGLWFSGNWNDSGAQQYEAAVKDYLNQKVWLQPNF